MEHWKQDWQIVLVWVYVTLYYIIFTAVFWSTFTSFPVFPQTTASSFLFITEFDSANGLSQLFAPWIYKPLSVKIAWKPFNFQFLLKAVLQTQIFKTEKLFQTNLYKYHDTSVLKITYRQL